MIYQKANEYDSKIHDRVRGEHGRKGLQPEKLYADSSYISRARIQDYRKHGQELMGYIRGENSPKPEDFKVEKFSIDMEKLEAVCPAEQVSINSSMGKNGEIRICFSQSVCMKCQFFKLCVGPGTKEKRRRLNINQYYDFI